MADKSDGEKYYTRVLVAVDKKSTQVEKSMQSESNHTM